MKPGDLIRIARRSNYWVSMYQWWGDKSRGIAPIIGEFHDDECGILLEDNSHQGGNGCRILTSSGTIGWVHRGDLRVCDEGG